MKYLGTMILILLILVINCQDEKSDVAFLHRSAAPNTTPLALHAIRSDQLEKIGEQITAMVEVREVLPFKAAVPAPTGKMTAHVQELKRGLESTGFRIYIIGNGRQDDVLLDEVINLYGLAWSPEGSKLAFCEGNILTIADSDGKTRKRIYAGPGGLYPGACFDLNWSEDGKEISFSQVENARFLDLSHPVRIVVTLGMRNQTASGKNDGT